MRKNARNNLTWFDIPKLYFVSHVIALKLGRFSLFFLFALLFLLSRLEGKKITEICKKNLAAAMTTGRKDLVQTWSLLSSVLDNKLAPTDSMDESPWALHPFGRKMIKSL